MLRHTLSWSLLGFFLVVFGISPGVRGNAGEKTSNDAKKETPKGQPPLLDEKGELKKDPQAAPRKSYPVKLEAGTIYRIELKSDKFDAFLRLEDSASIVVAEDDDSAGNLNARIYYKAEKSGAYAVVVTSKNRQVGSFSLSAAVAADRKVASEYPNKTIELKWTDGKAHYQGSLDQNDGIALGRFYKVFTITLDQGKRYRIDHRSADFDAYLVLEDADGKRLAHDDDGGDGVNARLTIAPPKTATYRVIATSLPARQLGAFVLDIAMVEPKKTSSDQSVRNRALINLVPFVQVPRVDSTVFD